jgi:chemotaxis protein histidine kinase CheA
MATLSEFFETEAKRYLDRLNELVDHTSPDVNEVYRNARGLRGSAQMARQDPVYRTALALETGARAVAQGALSWSDDIAKHVRQSVEDLATLIRGGDAAHLDSVAAGSVNRWGGAGVEMPGGATGAAAPAPARDAVQEFRSFAAAEVEGIADALDKGVQALSDNPMDREALKAILRRQRALLGAARLDEIPVVAEILRAVEDLTRVIAKLDIGVKREWLDIYRVAREGLKAATEPLRANENPQPSHPLSRLRHMRAELLERYGTGEAVSAAGGPEQGLVQAKSMTEAPVDAGATVMPRDASAAPQPPSVQASASAQAPAPAAPPAPSSAAQANASASELPIVDIVSLQYRGSEALRRALELRATVEAIAADDIDARDAVEELFDLIRLAQG